MTTLGVRCTAKVTLHELYANTWQEIYSTCCLPKPLMSQEKDDQTLLDDKCWHAECLKFPQEPMGPRGLSLGRNVNLS